MGNLFYLFQQSTNIKDETTLQIRINDDITIQYLDVAKVLKFLKNRKLPVQEKISNELLKYGDTYGTPNTRIGKVNKQNYIDNTR